MAGAGRNIPVYSPDVITRLVGTHLVKLHTLTFEHTMVFSGKDVIYCLAGVYLNIADFFCQFLADHGTSTLSRICLTISSLVFSSASAS